MWQLVVFFRGVRIEVQGVRFAFVFVGFGLVLFGILMSPRGLMVVCYGLSNCRSRSKLMTQLENH